MMTEAEIRDFLRGTTHNAMKLAVYERIIVRWLADREEAEQAMSDDVVTTAKLLYWQQVGRSTKASPETVWRQAHASARAARMGDAGELISLLRERGFEVSQLPVVSQP